ncbi:MAG: alpha/beta hydrolase [Acidobacteria bacterium]|nr:alpha/beta hydrolase [Acidobacteriota bacterium]
MARLIPRMLFLLIFLPLLGGEPIIVGERIRLRAENLQEDRDILISVPAAYGRTQQALPVLYVTDGDQHFLQLRGTLDFLARNGLAPEVILVGISNTHRTRDLTPTKGFAIGPGGRKTEIPRSGGGDAFLDFVEHALIPRVEATYRTLPFRILAGHSLGGTLALHAVATRPHLFQACIAISPALHWDEGYPVRKLEERLRMKEPLRCTLFATMGNEELRGFYPSPARFPQLRKLLKRGGPEGFQGLSQDYPDEDHGTVVFDSEYRGLRAIFEAWRLPVDRDAPRPEAGAFRSHYAKLSARLGFTVAPQEPWVNQAGYQLLEAGDAAEAIQVFRYNLELYPASINARDSLGEGLERAGKLKEALACYEDACALGAASLDPLLPAYTAHAERVRKALARP